MGVAFTRSILEAAVMNHMKLSLPFQITQLAIYVFESFNINSKYLYDKFFMWLMQ